MGRRFRPWLGILVVGGWALASLVGAGAARADEDRFEFDATMSGTGRMIGRADVTYAFRLWCEPDHRQNHLLIHWGAGERFTLDRVVDALCDDRPEVAPGSAEANFDTYRGAGVGSHNGIDGAHAIWTFTDAGREGDLADVTITDAAGNVVLRLSGPVQGDHRAEGKALLPPIAPGIDPDNLVHSVFIDAVGRSRLYTRTPLPADAVSEEPSDPTPKPDTVVEIPPPAIHPELERMLAEQDPDTRVVVVVSLRENLTVPRFPDLPRGVTRESPEAARAFAEQQALIQNLHEQRRRATQAFLQRLATPPVGATLGAGAAAPDVRVLEQFWLSNAFVADVRLGDVRALAALPDLLHIQPNRLDTPATPPTHDGSPDFPPHADVAAGRAAMGSDAHFNLAGMTDGYIGLIDTGVNTHTLLFPPNDNLAIEGDCVDGGSNCLQIGNPGFDRFDCHNHGTSSAAVLAGNTHLGNAVRGVTDIVVDSWKVWIAGPPHCTTSDGVTATAVQRAFQTGLGLADRVFAAVIQAQEPETGTIATAADNAFNAGAVVVAANGNCAVSPACNVRVGPPAFGTVRSPAIAHKVIGVGDFNVVLQTTQDYQGRGPAPDGRIKPDIQTPTDVMTASSDSFAALKARFGGTSAATPFAAGSAALVRNWLRKYNMFDPGYTYARLILSGNLVFGFFGYSNLFGAGHLRLPEPCRLNANWGKVTFGRQRVGQTTVFSIPIPVTSAPDGLAAALWWPESAEEAHDDIDLYILDPNGVERARATSQPSVWERVEVAGPLAPGTWALQIKGADIKSPPQTVYWTADLRRQCPRVRAVDRQQD